MQEISKVLDILLEIHFRKGRVLHSPFSGHECLREDLGFDSIDLAELTARLDHEFGVDVFADGPVQTVGEVLAKVKRSARRG